MVGRTGAISPFSAKPVPGHKSTHLVTLAPRIRRGRSFPVPCGSSEARVTAILVGIVSGACMNLDKDMKCRIYERRPLVCRIYPAEISPFVQFNTAAKACPPEAWQSEQVLLVDGQPIDPVLQSLIEQSRQTDRDEALKKGLLWQRPRYLRFRNQRRRLRGARTRTEYSAACLTPRPLRRRKTFHLRNRRGVSTRAKPATLDLLTAAGFATLSEKGQQDKFTFLHTPRSTPEWKPTSGDHSETAPALQPTDMAIAGAPDR